jgi:hypothetical protein
MNELEIPDGYPGPAELDLEPSFGEPVELEGVYEVDPIPGGKRFQGACLVLDDGTRYVIAYRPVPEHFRFLDKRVRVQGRPYWPGSDTQHIMMTHLEVHSIELAPGETPYATPPTEPVAPVARTAGDLAARDGRWVRVVGTLEAVRSDPDDYLGTARLRLADGTQVQARSIRVAKWTSHVGKPVTVTSRVARSEDGEVVTFDLVGRCAIQEGEV